MKHKLPFSTAGCEKSPKFEFTLGKLILVFDYLSGPDVKYAEIVFDGAICIKFTPDSLVDADMIYAYSSICEYEDSSWLIESREQSNPPFNPNLKHYRIYFDHYGCLDLIANSWRMTAE